MKIKIFNNTFIIFLIAVFCLFDLRAQTIYLDAENELKVAFGKIKNLSPIQIKNLSPMQAKELLSDFQAAYTNAKELEKTNISLISTNEKKDFNDLKLMISDISKIIPSWVK